MMIWFNIKELENKISNNDLSDQDGFNYLLAFFILSSIGYSFSSGNSNGWITFFGCVLSVLINVWGLRSVYAANKDIDGKDFFKRFFAIYWVIGFRLFLATILVGGVLGVLAGILSAKNGIQHMDKNPIMDIIFLIFVSMFSVICYLLMIQSIQRIKLKPAAGSDL
jgi:hypothetical protein